MREKVTYIHIGETRSRGYRRSKNIKASTWVFEEIVQPFVIIY